MKSNIKQITGNAFVEVFSKVRTLRNKLYMVISRLNKECVHSVTLIFVYERSYETLIESIVIN